MSKTITGAAGKEYTIELRTNLSGVSTNPAFLNAESKDFEVIADLSEITRGV